MTVGKQTLNFDSHAWTMHEDAAVRGHGVAAGITHEGATVRGHEVATGNGML